MDMKNIKYILLFALVVLANACIENKLTIETLPSEKVNFNYEVSGDYYKLDYLVGSSIQFTNTSSLQGNFTWDFGDGSPVTSEASPVHKYELAGLDNVTLTLENVGMKSYKILINDITPSIAIKDMEDDICEVNKTYLGFAVTVPNPDNKSLEYEWIFPTGTLDENGDIITLSTKEDPGKVKFQNVGSQTVTVQVKLGGRKLQEGIMKVPVGYTEAVKTLYFAVKEGTIQAYKLAKNVPSEVKVYPFDLGVKSGQHPYNLLFSDSLLYVIDAGKQIGYVNDIDGNLGDGKISVLSKDGLIVEDMLTNNGGTAFNDPHYGYIDETQKILYYTDRNTGIRRLSLNERNLQLDPTADKYAYFVQNSTLGYYKFGYDYGAIGACFAKSSTGVWWWPKTFNGVGIFRFMDSDIGGTTVPSSGMTAGGLFIKSFVLDEVNKVIYLAIRVGATPGIYAIPMADMPNESAGEAMLQNTIKNYLVKELVSNGEGTSGEYIDICQMALDPDDGSVYFGFRADPTSATNSGVMRCYKDGASYKVETVIAGVEIYGIAINHKKSKLF